MVVTFKTIYLTPKSQVHTVALPYSPQLSIWMMVGSQNRYSSPIWLFLANFGPTFDPILVQLTHFVTCVSSNNLMYALVVVSILKNVQ